MKTKKLISIVGILLILFLILTYANLSYAEVSRLGPGEAAVIDSKEEVVYGILGADGSSQGLYVVNRFVTSNSGSVIDYGKYSSVINLTDESKLKTGNGFVKLPVGEGNLYYQGNLKAKDLPWNIKIEYQLDGQEIAPSALTGKSGALQIHITTSKNKKVDPTFYEHYMMQITLTFDSEKCEQIKAPGGTSASAGVNQLVTYTVMPGKNADITLSAQIEDFSMNGIEFSALPYSVNIDLPDTGSLTGQFDTLISAVASLNKGAKSLSKGAAHLDNGTLSLTKGSSQMKQGLDAANNSADQLTQSSSQISAALSQIAAGLSGEGGGETDTATMAQLMQLPKGLRQLSAGLEEVTKGMAALESGLEPAYASLKESIEGIPSETITPEEIASLYMGLNQNQKSTADKLSASYAAAQKVKAVYASVKPAFDSTVNSLKTLNSSVAKISSQLSSMADQIEKALSQSDSMAELQKLSEGLSQLSEQYQKFDAGLKKYTQGISEIAKNYGSLDEGISSLAAGTGSLSKGTKSMQHGISALNAGVSDIPDQIQNEMDDMLGDYTSGDFTPVSFASPKNKDIDYVQFVIKTEPIEGPKVQLPQKSEGKESSFWEKLKALF